MEGNHFNQSFEVDANSDTISCYGVFADEFASLMKAPKSDSISSPSMSTIEEADDEPGEFVCLSDNANEQRAQPQPRPQTDRPANVPDGTIEPSCSTLLESDYRIRQFIAETAAGNPAAANRHVQAMTELLQEEFDRCDQNTLNWFYARLQRQMSQNPDSPLQVRVTNGQVQAGNATRLELSRTQADGTRRSVGTISFQLR
ncbi:MAG: hypothetical protein K2Z81_02565, partial [Cyanobacteria bacterium]|nr:hypothetical protein [Cyanobacteriota bacterium]